MHRELLYLTCARVGRLHFSVVCFDGGFFVVVVSIKLVIYYNEALHVYPMFVQYTPKW